MGCFDDFNPVRIATDVVTLGAAELAPIPGSGNLAMQGVDAVVGGVTGGGGKSTGSEPNLSTLSDRQLQELQVDALRRNAKYEQDYATLQKDLEPYNLAAMGLRRDETGKLIPDTESAGYRSQQVQKAADARVLAALEGRLDVDPSVEQDIARGEAQVKEELRRRLGPGAEGGDIWNRAMSEYHRQANALRYSVRHGEMSTSDAISTNRSNETLRRQNQYYNQSLGAANQLGEFTSRTGSMSEAALRRSQDARQFGMSLDLQRELAAAGMTGKLLSGGLSAAGTIIGASMLKGSPRTTVDPASAAALFSGGGP